MHNCARSLTNQVVAPRRAARTSPTAGGAPAMLFIALNCGISIGTVRKAVDGLVAEGLLEKDGGNGDRKSDGKPGKS